jgi:RNA polymerase sigma-70 factor (ECF subfamily)
MTEAVQWQNRAHFFATTATIMRRVLVDAARARKATKRRADVAPVSLQDIDPPAPEPSVDLAAIGDALTVLGDVAPRASRVVELRFFGGFTVEETAEALGVKGAVNRTRPLGARNSG